MNTEFLTRVKALALIALNSDDDLMEKLVLKGGNALDLVHKVAFRASTDLDFSMKDDFLAEELEHMEKRIDRLLQETFEPEGYQVFDVQLERRPSHLHPDLREFWGGYQVEFKIIEQERYSNLKRNHAALRRNAEVVGPRNKRKFSIQISAHEYCEPKQARDFEGFRIYVYTPEMIVAEKIRAICQQMPEYRKIVESVQSSPRPRDFFDIYTVIEGFSINFESQQFRQLLREVFASKRVPLELIARMSDFRAFHKQGFPSLVDTLRSDTTARDFDYYFDYVVGKCSILETPWKEDAPSL